MPSPRWYKIGRDLWGAKARTVIVALSIAVGVFAVGVVTQTFATVQKQLTIEYPKSNPASATLTTAAFDDDLVQTVRHMDGIEYAEGRSIIQVKILVGPDQWKQMLLYALPDFANINIGKILPQRSFPEDPSIGAERGVWPPPDRGVVVERASFYMPGMIAPGTKVGDAIEIQAPNDRYYKLQFAGLAHEPGRTPATFAGAAYGYITRDTLEWLTGSRLMDQLDIIVAENKLDQKHVRAVAEQVRDKIENGGRSVYSVQVPEPGKHPLQDLFQGLLLLLNALGLAALFLSGFLIVNTISALMSQQVRQIGMMKAIGARRSQIAGMYLVMVLIYGTLALAIAAPLSALAAAWASQLLAGFVNVDAPGFVVQPDILLVQAAIALFFPLIAGIVPVFAGTRVTVREAITDYGLGQSAMRIGLLDRLLDHVRGVSRPVLLSLRNTFRRKGRLALTLATLVLGGAIFIGVFSVRASMLLTLDDALSYWKFDVLIPLNRPYLSELVEEQIARVPGVQHTESWGLAMVNRLRADDSESQDLTLFAPPPDTTMLSPTIIQGRWLVPEDENALVVSNATVSAEPDLKVGDEITLKIDSKKSKWRIVGIARVVGNFGGVGTVYANYPYYARVTGQVGRTTVIQTVTDKHDTASETVVQKAMEESLKQVGIHFSSGITAGMIRDQNELFFNIIVVLLLFMAVLMALVGGLGLMGTMTLNVLERTREIGVMRAIGASNGSVRQIVFVEGILIGTLSWLLGAVSAVPFGQVLSDSLGTLIFQMPLHYVVSTDGIVIWFIVVVVISTAASLLPAHNASRLTIREILAYE